MVYGQPVQTPSDRLDGAHPVQGAQDVVDRVTELVARARQALAKAQAYQKRAYNSRHRAIEFAVGDLVLLSTRNLTLTAGKKLGQRKVGPFRVVARVGQ